MNKEQPKFDINNVPEQLRPYFEAKEKGTLKEYYLNELRHKRDDYSDELPQVDVRNLATLDEKGHFVGDKYKCRGNFIVGLSLALQNLIQEGVITESSLIEKIEQFKHYDFKFHHQEFTTEDEIKMINQILAEMIKYLEQ